MQQIVSECYLRLWLCLLLAAMDTTCTSGLTDDVMFAHNWPGKTTHVGHRIDKE